MATTLQVQVRSVFVGQQWGVARVEKMARRPQTSRKHKTHKKYNLTILQPPQRPLVYDSSPSTFATQTMHSICKHCIVSHSTPKLRPKMVSFLSFEGLRCTWCHFDDAHHSLDGQWPNFLGAGILAVARLRHCRFWWRRIYPRGGGCCWRIAVSGGLGRIGLFLVAAACLAQAVFGRPGRGTFDGSCF